MISAIRQYSREEILPRWNRILFQPQVLVASLLGYGTFKYAQHIPLATLKIGEFTSMLLTYAEISVGFCIAGLALVLTLPSESLVSLLMKHKLKGQQQNSYSDLIFVFSWTAVVHWIAIVLSIVGVCIRRAELGLLNMSDGWKWKLFVAATVAVTAYALIQFLLTVITLSQIGRLYVREFPRRPG